MPPHTLAALYQAKVPDDTITSAAHSGDAAAFERPTSGEDALRREFRQSSPFIKFRFDSLSAFKQRIESPANYRNDHAINPALLSTTPPASCAPTARTAFSRRDIVTLSANCGQSAASGSNRQSMRQGMYRVISDDRRTR